MASPRGAASPRPRGRENAKNVLCRNITIYGTCRAQGNGCPYNHDVTRRSLNVESPAFTPLATVTNTQRNLGISPRAATAAVFMPQSDIPEFVPQRYNDTPSNSSNMASQGYDSFAMQSLLSASSDMGDNTHQAQINPYAQDSAAMFQSTSAFSHPLNYHFYSPMGPHRENLMAYQRTTHDFFIPDQLREDLQRKSEAARQVFPNSGLPQQLEHFHSLVALDTNAQKPPSIYGYPSWIYKAVSTKDGFTYALRRLEGFRLTDERAIRTIQTWKRVSNGSVVTVHDAFTTRAFGDSSLIVVTDYHPMSQTLAERHFPQTSSRHTSSRTALSATDHELWGYLVQLCSALTAVHGMGLAARPVMAAKVLWTAKNRIRLNACGVLDIANYTGPSSDVAASQRDDLAALGRLILQIATNNPNARQLEPRTIEQLARIYSRDLCDALRWLLAAPSASSLESDDDTATPTIQAFGTLISGHILQAFDASLHASDSLDANLARELENARLVRLTSKLSMILERPDPIPSPNNATSSSTASSQHQPSSAWSETGERYYLKLFRDYVYHQVDSDGRPVLDLGHMLACLNKLDAGIEEKVMLVSRDEQSCFVVSYRELKRGVESAWSELVKAAAGSALGRR